MMDQEELGQPCVPWEEDYESSSGIAGILPFVNDVDNLMRECDDTNDIDSCGRKVCKVEGMFIVQYLQWSLNGNTFDESLRHSEGFIADQNNCPTVKHLDDGGDERCCGDYPFRMPYKYNANVRECCNKNNIATI